MRRIMIAAMVILSISVYLGETVIGQNSELNGNEIKLSHQEWKKLNTFFSNFSEVLLQEFKAGQISNEELIRFAISHNYRNNFNLFKPYNSSQIKLASSYVEATVKKYFGIDLIKHQTIAGKVYQDGYYIVTGGAGETFVFAQVKKFIAMGNDYYVAYLNIYCASSGFTGDVHGTSWQEARDGDIPKLCGTIRAIARKINSDNGSRYILIEYLEDK